MTAGDRSRLGPPAKPARIGKRLEAPHRRRGASPRIVERTALVAYRATSWLLASVPPKPAASVIGRLSQASYLLWPTKRRWSNLNFGRVLGLPPEHRRVREAALAAYMGYGQYLVELMRLPTRRPEEIARLIPTLDVDEVRRIWQTSPGGLIMTVGHVGSNEAVAAAIAHQGMPINVVADDSSFPEIYEILRRQREGWGVKLIAWRNLREIFSVLRQREILGLLVDWGYRADGIPVRLFGEWTALPAGPATLAAKTRSLILPITIRRQPDDTFHVSWTTRPIEVPSADPADLQRATQEIADALAGTIAAAPDQWYSFKPIWPSTNAEAADLERRASLMQAGVTDPGPAPEFA
jgi:phosphatidylinositol dimannoside acyltransferase